MPRQRFQDIVDQMVGRIRSGTLVPGVRLPTVRAMARTQGMAVSTVARAYAQLQALGLIVGEAGRGTFVCDPDVPRGSGLSQAGAAGGVVDMSFNYPTLPDQVQMLRDGLRQLAAEGDLEALLHSHPHGGRRHERAVVAQHLERRGLQVTADQVLIANGAQQALATACTSFLMPGDVIAADALTYFGFKSLAQSLRLEIAAVPGDGVAMDIDALERLCQRRRIRAVYTMPTMHNPLGQVMSAERRQRLAAIARHRNLLLIEDAAFAFLAEPAPAPLFTHAPERCIYVSGLSKSVAAGLRFGMIAAAPELVPAMRDTIRNTTWSSPALSVALGCRWIETGEVDDLEIRKRLDAADRQKLVQRVLERLDYAGHPTSYYTWLRLHDGLRADQVAAELAGQNILVSTAQAYATTKVVPHALRLALGSVDLPTLGAALGKIRRAAGAW